MEKLLALAAHLETTDSPYRQRMWLHCAFAQYVDSQHDEVLAVQYRQILNTASTKEIYDFMGDQFGLDGIQAEELFGEVGCGDAGNDKLKAAAYIRDFVARHDHMMRLAA